MVLETSPRCLLFIPAVKVEAYSKRLDTLDIDGVIFDLEDSVEESHKAIARSLLEEFLQHKRPKPNIYIRPNGVSTPQFEGDLEMISRVCPDAIMIPKLESADNIRSVLKFVEDYEQGRQRPLGLFPIIETLEAYRDREEIVRAVKNKAFLLTVGYEDFSGRLGIDRPDLTVPNAITNMTLEVVVTCKIHGVQVIDSVCRKFKQKHLSDFEREVEFGRQSGMCGKLAIHPNQIDIINRVYGTRHALEMRERRLLRRFSVLDDGTAVIVNDAEEMEDMPSYRRAVANLRRLGKSI